jgi:transcriptional regulator with XRE-family HTH domain
MIEAGEAMAKRKTTRIQHAEIVGRFAARLRELRHSRGLTQAALAGQAQVTVSYIGRLEAAGAAPGIDLVERLATALGSTVTDLLPTAAPPDTDAILRQQARNLFDALLKSADRPTLLMLNPLLARLNEAATKGG